MRDESSLLNVATSLADTLEPGDLDETLSRIATAAVKLIPEVAYASITVRRPDDRLDTACATDGSLTALDEKQYTLRQGPCYEAATDRTHVFSSDLANDPRFPDYGPAAAAVGIRAQAAFRLFDRNGTQGALNLYAVTPGAFTDLDNLASLFRSQAGTAIAYAYEVSNLNDALETRTTIGKAMGIVMERYQLNDERAFAFLTRLSQHRNVKLRVVAEELVKELTDRIKVAHRAAGEQSDEAAS